MSLIPVITSDGMTVEKDWICRCDQCGHKWLPDDEDKEPERCAKCKSRTWNRKAKKTGPKPRPRKDEQRGPKRKSRK